MLITGRILLYLENKFTLADIIKPTDIIGKIAPENNS